MRYLKLTSRPSGMFTFINLCTASSKLSYRMSAIMVKVYRESTYRVHDGQINRPSQVDQVCFRHVLNSSLLWGNIFIFIVFRFGVFSAGFGTRLIVRVAQNFTFDSIITFFVLDKVWVGLEQVWRSRGQLKKKKARIFQGEKDLLRLSCTCNSSSKVTLWVICSSSSTRSKPSGMAGLSLYLSFRT